MATKSFTKTIIISDKDAIKKLKEKKVRKFLPKIRVIERISSLKL